MKLRNFKNIAAITLAVGILAGLPNVASALTFGDDRSFGQVLFGIPSGDASRTSYVNHIIDMTPGSSDSFSGQTFNRSDNVLCFPTCPDAVFNSNGTSTTISLGTGGFTYLFAKYDGPNAGAEVWSLIGLTGDITIPANGLEGQNYGLSGWTIFGGTTPPPQAPDGGSTVALLGVALGGLEAMRRMLRARKA